MLSAMFTLHQALQASYKRLNTLILRPDEVVCVKPHEEENVLYACSFLPHAASLGCHSECPGVLKGHIIGFGVQSESP